MKYDQLELHLAPLPLSRTHAKKIKAVGGKYSAARGYASARYVTVPARERSLIDDLVRTYFGAAKGKRMTIVATGGDEHKMPSWVSVQYIDDPVMCGKDAVEQFEHRYGRAFAHAVKRRIIKPSEWTNADDDRRQ